MQRFTRVNLAFERTLRFFGGKEASSHILATICSLVIVNGFIEKRPPVYHSSRLLGKKQDGRPGKTKSYP